jgi:cell division septation protein DedD
MASRTRADAESLAKLLRGRGYPAFVLSARAINAKDHLFRVLVGPYTTRDRAETYLKKLEKEGFQPFIKH